MGGTARRWTPTALVAVLAAGALGPVLATAVGATGMAVAWAGVAGSVGGNILTDVVKAGVARLDDRGVKPSSVELEAELERRIEEILLAGGKQAAGLRAEIARVLRQTEAVGAAIEAAVASGDRELQSRLAAGLAEVGAEFGEFGFVLAELGVQLRLVRDAVDRQSADLQLSMGLQYRQATDLRLMAEQVSSIERRTRLHGEEPGAVAGLRWRDGCPYRGLVAFHEADAEVFYGREIVTAQLVTTLSRHLAEPGILVLTGASGAGKSSLLRAGLMPAISRGELTDAARHWPRQVIDQPTLAPLSHLATLLARMAGLDALTVLHALTHYPEQAHLLVRQAVETDARRRGLSDEVVADCQLVLVVDQFEEVFTQRGEPHEQAAAVAERTAFIAALHAAATNVCGPNDMPAALVVLAVRGDFVDRCAEHPPLASALARPFILGPMSEIDLRCVITGPADAAGLDLEPGLADTILAELRAPGGGYEAGALPLLSQALLTIWQHRQGNRLTNRGYARTGGVQHAVATSAESAYTALTATGQEITRRLFHQLTLVSRTGVLTRRTITRHDSQALHGGSLHADTSSAHAPPGVMTAPAAADEDGTSSVTDDAGRAGDDVDLVVESFARQRLLVLDGESLQISHDILLVAWPRLRSWLEIDLTENAQYGQLLEDADEWEQHGRKTAYLYRGERLTALGQVLARWQSDPRRYPPLPAIPRDFLRTSAGAEKQGTRRRRTLLTVLVILVIAAVSAAVVAYSVQEARTTERDAALARRLVTQSELTAADPSLSAMLAATAEKISSTPETRAGMRAAFRNPGPAILTGHTRPVLSVAFSPDGTVLASGTGDTDNDGTVRLWDVRSRKLLGAPLTGHTSPVSSVAFSPDGTILASGSGDDTVRLWDVRSHKPLGTPLTGHTGGVSSVAFNPHGTILASGSGNSDGGDATVRLWDVRSRRPLGAPLTRHTAPVSSVAFNPDGTILAFGSTDDTVRLWDVRSRRPLGAPLTGHTAPVESVAFSPDGTILASGSSGTDTTVRLWDVRSHKPLGTPLTGHTSGVRSVAFSPDGTILASGSVDTTVRLWDVRSHKPLGAPFTGHTGSVSSVAFSPDSAVVASGSGDAMVRLWDVRSRRPLGAPLTGHTAPVESVAFNPDGTVLASGGDDGTVRLWDVRSHKPLGAPLTGHTGGVSSVAFSPDGTILASGNTDGSDGTVRLWDVASRRPLGAPLTGHTGGVSSVAFNPDGTILASGNTDGSDGTVRLWDVASRRPLGAR
ncbi:AAA family ATPase, partial [Nonomuraea sp. NPDC052129]|uniref:nSTAND1 domain-containing NTPase n=1 Tax=Nonomuraea sp. NPDC052129 TaxID=3154651 RepID=UPI0034416438